MKLFYHSSRNPVLSSNSKTRRFSDINFFLTETNLKSIYKSSQLNSLQLFFCQIKQKQANEFACLLLLKPGYLCHSNSLTLIPWVLQKTFICIYLGCRYRHNIQVIDSMGPKIIRRVCRMKSPSTVISSKPYHILPFPPFKKHLPSTLCRKTYGIHCNIRSNPTMLHPDLVNNR